MTALNQNKKVEELLREKELVEKTIESLLDTYFIFNVNDGQPLKWNKAFREKSGYSDEEIKKLKPADFYEKEDREKIIEATQKVLSKGYGRLEATLITKDGKRIPYEYIGVLLKDYMGISECICAIGRDVSERKRIEDIEKSFQESEERLSWITDASHDYLMMLDLDLNIQFVNRAEVGLTIQDLLGKPLYTFVEERFQSSVKSYLTQAIKEQRHVSYETEYIRPNGEIIYYESVASPIVKDHRVIGLTVSSRDISSRKKMEKALKKRTDELGERVKELSFLYELSKTSADSDISINDFIRKFLELIPQSMQYPDITCARIIFQQEQYISSSFKESFWVLRSSIVVSGKKAGIIEVFYLEKKPNIDEGPFLREERELIDNLARELGKFLERRQAENKIDFLHSILKHDLGNKIQIIHGYLSLLNKIRQSKKSRELINIILNTCNESQVLIDKIYMLEEMDESLIEEVEETELIPIIKSVLEEYLGRSEKVGITLEFESENDDVKILGGILLRDIYSNLLDNAIVHSKGSLIKILILEEEAIVKVIIEDDGIGIPESIKSRLIERGIKGDLSTGT